jgi:hypothetical protein
MHAADRAKAAERLEPSRLPASDHVRTAATPRIDSSGGFAVVETDAPALIARDVAIFRAFFDMNV